VRTVAPSVVLACAIWLASGTLAPYAQLLYPLVTEPCHYLLNVDHEKNTSALHLFEGAGRETWASSPVLRRILYPLVAYPFVRVAGDLAGGLLCNILITIAAMLAFGRFVENRHGPAAARSVVWLLATYPGITYWAGLPYPYAAIVPLSLLSAMIIDRMDAATTAREIALLAVVLGGLLLAYDLAPFFVPAAVLVLVRRKKWLWAAIAGALAMAPSLVLVMVLRRVGVPLMNENTQGYVKVLMAYRHPGIRHPGLGAWFAYLKQLPQVLMANFFDSNFFFLPLLAIIAVLIAGWRRSIGRVEAAILLTVLAVFLFNNAAPPYYGWQLRGVWIPRLYQPMFVALLLVVAGAVSQTQRKALLVAVAATVVLNATIAFGPIANNPLAFYLDYRFYRHAQPETFAENLANYGRRPLGLCATPEEAKRQRPRPLRAYPMPDAYRPEPSPR
jgi:hypothetical protein